MTAPTDIRPVIVRNVTVARVVHAEWLKLRSLRSTAWTLLSAVAALVVIGAVVAYATNKQWASVPSDVKAHFDPIPRSLVGVNLAQLAIGVLGVLLISGEYSTGMIRASLAAVPARWPVLVAKAGLYAVITFAVMLPTTFIAFVLGQNLLGTHGTTLSAPHAVTAIFGAAAYLTLIGLLALGLGFIVRSTAGAIAALVGLLLVLPGIGQVLPTSWRNNLLPFLPSNAGASMFNPHPQDPAALTATQGLLVLSLWVLVSLLIAGIRLQRRDA